jgi:hypothetical protein
MYRPTYIANMPVVTKHQKRPSRGWPACARPLVGVDPVPAGLPKGMMMGREPAAPCLWWGSIHTGRPRAVAAHTWDSPCTEEVTRDGALLDGSQSCLTVVNLASWPRRVQLLLISHGQRVRRPEMNRGDGGVGPGGERFHQPSHVDVACRVPQRCLACDVYGMHVMCVCNSVDRPRFMPSCSCADFCWPTGKRQKHIVPWRASCCLAIH